MIRNYQLTPLEKWVQDLYFQIGVVSTAQLNINYIASTLNIWYYELNMSSKVIDSGAGLYSICIDKRLSPQRQWQDFLHELCHALRHYGDQVDMPDLLIDWQEWDADTFMIYASMPFFLIRDLELPKTRNEIIPYLASQFGVTKQLAAKRLEQIERRILLGRQDAEFFSHQKKPVKVGMDKVRRMMEEFGRNYREREGLSNG